MNIYAYVCQLHFVQGICPEEIAEYFKDELSEYVHQRHEHAIKYTRAVDAVNVIIECEKKSHQLARNFEP